MRTISIIVIFTLLPFSWLNAQSLTPSGMASMGSFQSNSNVNLSVTMGQSFSATLMSNSNLLTQGFEQPEVEIRSSIAPVNICQGNSFTLPYESFGFFDPTNIFTAQLSNSTGSFSNPQILGTITSASSGIITCHLPANIPNGTGYRMRVVSSHPYYHGTETTNFSINSLSGSPVAISMNPNPVLPGQLLNTMFIGYGPTSVTLTASGLSGPGQRTYSWSSSAAPTGILSGQGTTSIQVSPTVTTTYTLTTTDPNGCVLMPKPSFTVNVVNIVNPVNPNLLFVCHNGNMVSVNANSAMAHLNHGDKLGACSNTNRNVIAETENSVKENFKVQILPNPSNNHFNININSKKLGPVSILVTDLIGRTIESRSILSNSVLTVGERYSPGTYIIKMLQAGVHQEFKLIKL